MQNLVERWNDAAENNLNPAECINLVADTEQVGTFLENSSETHVSDEKIADLRHAILEGFGKLKKPELFTQWFLQNSSKDEGAEIGLKEACKSLHHLFSVVVEVNNTPHIPHIPDSSNGDFYASHGLATFTVIDIEAKSYLKASNLKASNNNSDLNLPKETIVSIYDHLSLQDLASMRSSSAYSREIVNKVLVNRLNSGQISFSDLKLHTEKEMNAFIGDSSSEILSWFAAMDDSNLNDDTQILSIGQLSVSNLLAMREDSKEELALANLVLTNKLNSGKISFLDLKIFTSKDLNVFFGESASDIVCLEVKNNKLIADIETTADQIILCVAQLSSLEELTLPAFYEMETFTQDISALKYCQNLKTLKMLFNDNIDISVLKNCPKLEDLDISSCAGRSDISILSYLPAIRVLDISNTNITDIKVLNDLHSLERIYCYDCEIADSDLQALRNRNIKIM